jgi:predicted porin
MKKYSLCALVAAGLLAGGLVTSANAADLGGNCCADLEERIAELEATTARKGNRKVSLTVSGWVAEQVTWWDDGVESNTYVNGLGTTLATNVKFTGQATIAPGWSAGYVLHLEANDSDSLTMSANQTPGLGLYSILGDGKGEYAPVNVLQSYWFIKSDHWGKVSVGQQSQASDNTAILVDGSGSLVPANWVAFDFRAFEVRTGGANSHSGLLWGVNVGSCRGMGGTWGDCNGLTQQAVRYDSPTFAGFSASSSWGADDFWDVAIRYAGEFSGFKLAAAAAYDEVTDQNYNNLQNDGLVPGGVVAPNGKLEYFQLGVYVQHVPTGLFVLYDFGHLDDDFSGFNETDTHYVKAGIRTKCLPFGATIVYGEYEHVNDSAIAGVGSNDARLIGAGVVQEIDPAAMSVWLKYRNLDFDDSTTTNYKEFNEFAIGGLINF